MKKILTFILAAVMLVSATVIYTGAAGSLIFEDTFEKSFAPRNWITDSESCAFKHDKENQCIVGYNDAKVLQSQYGGKYDKWWAQYYTSFDFQIRGFDDLPEQEGRTHSVSVWYNDLMEKGEAAGGASDRGANYLFSVEIETGKAILEKSYDYSYKDENGVTQDNKVNAVIAEGQLPVAIEVAEDAPYYSIGMRVTSGKIECYFEEQLILSSSVEDGKEAIGGVFLDAVDATVGSEKSAVLFFNDGNYIAIDNFQVWTPDYDFESLLYGDANGDGSVNISDVTKMLQAVAGWEITGYNEAAANVNGDNAVNLSDITKVLQFIAGWEGIILGPTA